MRSKEVELAIYRLAEVQDNHLKAILYNKEEQDEDIKTLLNYISELEAKLEFKQFGDLDNLQFENTYLDKQVIRDKIALYELEIETLKTLYPKSYTKDDKYKLYVIKIQELKSMIGE